MVTDEPQDGTGNVAVRIALKVVPGSRADAVVGPFGGRLKVKVAAAAEGGRANEAVCELLARELGVRARDVTIVSGPTHPEKVVRVQGVDADTVLRKWAD